MSDEKERDNVLQLLQLLKHQGDFSSKEKIHTMEEVTVRYTINYKKFSKFVN